MSKANGHCFTLIAPAAHLKLPRLHGVQMVCLEMEKQIDLRAEGPDIALSSQTMANMFFAKTVMAMSPFTTMRALAVSSPGSAMPQWKLKGLMGQVS